MNMKCKSKHLIFDITCMFKMKAVFHIVKFERNGFQSNNCVSFKK